MYYRGDDFGANPQVPDQAPPDPGFTEPQFLAPTKATYEGAYPDAPGANPGGFLGQLAGVVKTFGAFFSPFIPVLAPALGSIGGAAAVVTAANKLGGVIRPTIEAITTATGGTITGTGATSFPPSQVQPPTSVASPKISSPLPPPPLGTSSQVLGPLEESGPLGQALRLQVAAPRRSSRGTRRSRPPSRAQRAALLAEVRRQLQR